MTREEVYLAALLHDIGKFYQRADEKGSEQSTKLSKEIKNLKDVICPSNPKGFSHKHVLWTAQFFEDQKELFGNVLKRSGVGNIDQLLTLAAKHHNPETFYEKIIQKADHYSAGMDRNNEASWKDAEKETNTDWDAFKRIRMRSVFGLIGKENSSNGIDLSKIAEIPLHSLSISKEYINNDLNKEENYSELWNSFVQDIQKLKETNIKMLAETIAFILEKYTSRIPASTVTFPDVSLYDHLKTTAAFAIVLYDYISENTYKEIPTKDQNPFLLVGGDLTGIQKFIYGVATHGAAKNLKGRSFYLQMLVDSIVTKLLHLLKLPGSCVIFKSGGNFYILAPNTEATRSAINIFMKEIEKKLFKYHSTQLYLVLDFVDFGEKNIFDDIGFIWNNLAEKINFKKRKKFITLIQEDYDQIFGKNVVPVNNKLGRDYITGEPILEGEKTKLLDEDDDTKVKEYTYKQIELGKHLKDVEYWIISFEKIPYWDDIDDIFIFDPIELGCYNYFIKSGQFKKLKEKLKGSADNLIVRKFNSLDFLDNSIGYNNNYGFVFYAGNDYPKDTDEQPKVFEELAGVEFKDKEKRDRKSSPNLVRLGVLRMDVDNLGSIFKDGIEISFRSFSRYACLSRNLDLFFSGYLNTLWGSEHDYKNYTQIIYAGGDDLFIVGKWNMLIKLASSIYSSFKNWTCNNDKISISGGLAIVTPKFPILKAAEYAEKEEKNAKEHVFDGKHKDSFSIFKYAFNWNRELFEIIKIKDQIKELLLNDLSYTFTSNICNIMSKAFPENDERLSEQQKKSAELYKIRSKWLIAYYFKRASIRYVENDKIKQFYNEWSKNIFVDRVPTLIGTDYSALQIIAIAARWADFEIRSEMNDFK